MTTTTRNLMCGVATALLLSAGIASAQTDTQGQTTVQTQQGTQTQQGGTQTGTQVETQADTGTQTETQTGTQSGTETDTQTDTQADTQADTQSETDTDQGQAQTDTDSGTEAEADQQADTKRSDDGKASVDITEEQQTQLKQRVDDIDVDRIEVDFDVAIGVSVPGTVVLHPVPTVIVEIVPDFAGYLFFMLIDGRIAVVHPDTHLVVAVI